MKNQAAPSAYEAYLRTDHWKAVKASALARAAYRCQLCNSAQKLQVHHRTYERLNGEQDNDVIALCQRCHVHFHGLNGGPKRHLSQPSRKSKKSRKNKRRVARGGKWNVPKHGRPSSRITIRTVEDHQNVTDLEWGGEMQEAVDHMLDITNPHTNATGTVCLVSGR